MLYKTIALELQTANESLCGRLKGERRLLAEMHRLSAELKERHVAWIATLTGQSLADDPRLTASRAMELALEELRAALSPSASAAE
jgi:hypothetical protein